MNLKHTPCDCAEWRRLTEACADLLADRDRLKKLIAEKDANLGKRVCQYKRCIEFSELQAERDALRDQVKDLIQERNQALDSLRARDSLMVAFKEKAELEANEFRELIDAHNNACHAACVWRERNRGCSDYTSRGKTCPECPMDYIIDYQMQEIPNA